jgi:hemolysin activation/secretion protein
LFSVRGFASDERMNFGRAAYVIPVGYWGTRLGVSYTTFDYRLAKDFVKLNAFGEGEVSTLYALHPFLRTRNANFLVQIAYETKSLEDYVDSVKSFEKRNISAGKVGGIGDWRDGMLGGGFNSYSLNYTGGKLTIAPGDALKADQTKGSGLFTNGEFSKTNAEFKRLQRITGDLNLLFAYSGQYASKNLASAEKFSLGGPSGVRAYPVGEGTGDSGYLVSAELRYIIPKYKVFQGDVTASAFYDMGNVQLTQEALLTNHANMLGLAGYGLGLSLGKEGGFLVKTSAAWRTENQAPSSDGARRIPRVWVQAIKWF